MTISISSSQGLGAYRADRDNLSVIQLLKLAEAGDVSCARKLNGEPDFIVDIVTDTDTSNLQAVDLTDEGVLFPADSVRTIRCKSYCSTDNDHYMYEWEEDVLGGTTPALLGQRIINGWCDENGTVGTYGLAQFQATVTSLATLTTIFATKGFTVAAITAGDADIVIPKSRLCIPRTAALSGPSVFTASTAGWAPVVDPALLLDGTGTDAVQFANSTGTLVTSTSPVLGGILTLAFEIWPPHNHRLVINTANVEVQCTCDAVIGDEVLRHRVEVFVGKLTQLQHHS